MSSLSSIFHNLGALTLCLSFSLLGQIAQNHPGLCGDETHIVPVPANLSAALNRSNGQGELTLQINGSARSVELPGVQEEIREVCPLSRNRLIVFGWYQTIHVISILDQTNGSIIDSFMGYDPVMSPDQHWLVMRDFYPLHPEVASTEIYLLYDLSQSASANRHGLTPYTAEIRGRVIYPLVTKNIPFDKGDVPDSEEHRFRSHTFQWASDSQSLVFADSVQNGLSIVLVTLANDKIQPTSIRYPGPRFARKREPPLTRLISFWRMRSSSRPQLAIRWFGLNSSPPTAAQNALPSS